MRRLQDDFSLTPAELRTHFYQNAGRLRAVRPFITGDSVTLTSASRVVVRSYRATARCRVIGVAWSGDTAAMKIHLYKESGQKITDQAIHIPCLSGEPAPSTYATTPYPTVTAAAYALQAMPQRRFILGAHFVIARGENFLLEYSLENPIDAEVAAGRSWTVHHTLHLVEFP